MRKRREAVKNRYSKELRVLFSTKCLPYNLKQFCYFSVCPFVKGNTAFRNSLVMGGRQRDWDDETHPGRLASWKKKD